MQKLLSSEAKEELSFDKNQHWDWWRSLKSYHLSPLFFLRHAISFFSLCLMFYHRSIAGFRAVSVRWSWVIWHRVTVRSWFTDQMLCEKRARELLWKRGISQQVLCYSGMRGARRVCCSQWHDQEGWVCILLCPCEKMSYVFTAEVRHEETDMLTDLHTIQWCIHMWKHQMTQYKYVQILSSWELASWFNSIEGSVWRRTHYLMVFWIVQT